MSEKIIKEIQEDLEKKLHTSGNYGIPYHPESIMTYKKICSCDDGYLCEHRRKWIIDYISKLLNQKS